jgi:hypothetical protein
MSNTPPDLPTVIARVGQDPVTLAQVNVRHSGALVAIEQGGATSNLAQTTKPGRAGRRTRDRLRSASLTKAALHDSIRSALQPPSTCVAVEAT